jgi:UDP-glucose 4-epimerase
MTKKPKVLITGGSGFIGYSVAKFLNSKGFQVKIFDITQPAQPLGEYYLGSMMYADELYWAMKDCDYVVHLAALLGVKRTEQNRLRCLDLNINGTRNILDAAVRAGIKKVVFSSSSEVYGEPLKTPISESDRLHPKSVYAVTKLAGEEYLKAYHDEHGLDYTIVRFFNIYGPGQVAEFVLPKFIRSAMAGKPITVNGDGKQTRSFCYVDDAARGVYLALVSKKANGHVFNIGNDRAGTSMTDLASKVINIVGSKKSKIVFIKEGNADRTGSRDILNRLPDISKARKILKYNPKIGLDKGIKLTIKSGNIPEAWAK